jgi:hypothetical protein
LGSGRGLSPCPMVLRRTAAGIARGSRRDCAFTPMKTIERVLCHPLGLRQGTEPLPYGPEIPRCPFALLRASAQNDIRGFQRLGLI